MQLILYFACMRILWRESRTRYSYFLMGYSTLLCLDNVMYTVSSYIGVELAYIDNRNFPGGVVGFLIASAVLPTNIVSITAVVIGDFLTDALLLWRVRVIWRASLTGKSRANVAMLIPGILVLASLGLGIAWDIETAAPGGFYVVSVARISLAYFSLSLVSNLVMTGMIVYRIWTYQSIIRQSLGGDHGSHYNFVTTMFVESAALYSIMSILVLGAFAANSTLSQIFLGLAPGVQLISSYFIIWRVAEGRALSKETITAPTNSLRFYGGTNSAGGQISGGTGLTFSTNPSDTTALASASTREVSIPLQELGTKESWNNSAAFDMSDFKKV